MPVNELLRDVQSGRCSEGFATGTAAIVCPVSVISERNGQAFKFNQPAGPVATRIRQELLDVQEGRSADPFGWVVEVPQTINRSDH